MKGFKHSEGTKETIRFNAKNNPNFGMKGKKHTIETKKKLSEAQTGKKLSEETKKKIKLKMFGKNIGEKNWNWQGGIAHLPYSVDWTRSLRISIRERDKYICKICGERQGDKAHDVHHIDYDKKNCNSDNLITLCHFCHNKTNGKREYWTNYFNQLK